jgi:16S rRNA (guanine(527)-N(7))-methyltransferase RsmG
MDTARIADLLSPFLEQLLSESQLHQISTYIDLLLRWNARINLTAIRNEEEIVTRHFGESLFLARHLLPTSLNSYHPHNPCHPERSQDTRGARVLAESKDPYSPNSRQPDEGVPATPDSESIQALEGAPSKLRLGGRISVLDIGSGAGFPALPLKIWSPEIHLTLIESNHKKTAFLREVARALTLTNIDVISDRAETLAAREDFLGADVVTLRAVERFETILPQAKALLAPNATLALLISAAQIPPLTKLTGLKWNPPIPVPESHTRVLSIGVRQ